MEDSNETVLLMHIRELYLRSSRIGNDGVTTALTASEDINEPIYFWQLYDALGENRIRGIIHTFYTNVFQDEDASWFREAFEELGSIEHHVNSQTRFWLDVTGGGTDYRGGVRRLRAKHKIADDIMNDEGSRRWTYHFIRALRMSDLGDHPVRVIACIIDFLNFFMSQYATEFDFNCVDFRVMLDQRSISKL